MNMDDNKKKDNKSNDKKSSFSYETLWKSIIRPPRDLYSFKDLGPSSSINAKIKIILEKNIIL